MIVFVLALVSASNRKIRASAFRDESEEDLGGAIRSCLTDGADVVHCAQMNTKVFAALMGMGLVATGCVRTVSGTKTAAWPLVKDRMEGKYERSVNEVYEAAKAVITSNGVLSNEYIPHDTTNTVRALDGKVKQRTVWIRVESVDPSITSVTVQARTKGGGSDIELVHELEKEIALKLVK